MQYFNTICSKNNAIVENKWKICIIYITKKGDLFIKYIERTKDKSEKVKKILNSLKDNKLFYKNRELPDGIKLSLTLKPRGK